MNTVSFVEARDSIRREILQDAALGSHISNFIESGAWYVPCAGNLGDGLIGLGTLDLFHHLGVAPPVYTTKGQPSFPRTKHLILGGSGGWFEGLWNHWEKILTEFLNDGGNLLILPSTINGFVDFFSRYAGQIIIFAREKLTYDNLKKVPGLEDRVFLSHDLAFALNFSRLDICAQPSRSGALHIFRQDAESKEGLIFAENYDLPLIWSHKEWADRGFCLRMLRPVMELMQLLESIQTDRLHMSILGAMLGCRVDMYPGSYFKNVAVYEHSLSRFNTVQFVETLPIDGVRREDLTLISQLRTGHDAAVEKLELERRCCAALREQLHEMRLSLLKYEEEADSHLNSVMNLTAELKRFRNENERLSMALSSFQGSRGYRLWLAYNRVYESRAVGSQLRRLRGMVGALLRSFKRRF
ncbi:polysaccharide pyruvyl transferase family protein [Candidimonas nitroreducens]|uniref:Polysaccharide pyruvyl transferase domain-containing protein n=1 Tax=Candidimonas nitroreducens TaxID=683354 RepID=A0A225MRN1_9BURK|nr:polysaccharide pyruvyl transferase family protein [Candidimonas nitroreducens]OWT63858.1 hypothetical protein CEY11_06000 [Candidimonas nitroreducens]